ncbi:hypothetical protein CPB85DRAFT_1496359 [Mucidula mucida]|nr:hypothetical protein CPB85DRAFT_1496359 [Mucidula mucida]
MIHSKSLTKRAFSFAMLYRFISLILISALSVGAIAKDSCAAVSKDCDDLGKQVDVVEAAMQKFLTSHSRSDGLACHNEAQHLAHVLKDVGNDAQARTFDCVPAASDATAICGKLTEVAPQIKVLLKSIDQVVPLFKEGGAGNILCNDVQSIEDSYKEDVAVFFKKVSHSSDASKLAGQLSDALESTKKVACSA